MRPSRLLILVGSAFAVAAGAFGYTLTGQTWPQGSTVTMHLSLGGDQTLIDGSTSFGESAENGLAQWNQYLSRLQYSVVRNSSLTPQSGDRRNSVFFSSTVYRESFDSTTLAVTLRTSVGSTIVETDVIFNSAKSWNSYRGPLQQAASGGTLHEFQRVAIHEFGHALGLDHPDQANENVAAIMNSRQSNIDALQTDDIRGGQYLYGGTTPTATPTPSPAAADNLVNLSTRAHIGAGENVMIGGVIVQGTQPTQIALRALGPSLSSKGVSGVISDPVLELRNASGTLLQQNDDWQENATAAATLTSYGLAPSHSYESGMVADLGSGNYTAIVSGFDNATGVGLVEFYDLRATAARLANISTRGVVGTDDRAMIAGFIVGGDKNKQVVIRALGPSLANAGVAGVLADPVLELRNSSGMRVGVENDDWRTGADAASIESRGLAPTHEHEAALMATLDPGSYTAIMRGYGGTTGVGLVEVYDLSPPPNQ
ncbi:MAG: matrixin family metalloprotease [Chthoniobacterales bacterium]|nr:matrixin family metalloprotease [Chthoniobacterales bacterium]